MVNAKLKVRNAQSLKTSVEDFAKKLERAYYSEIKKRLLSENVIDFFITRVHSILDEMQAEYFSGPIGAEDPTNVGNSRNKSRASAEVRKNFQKAATSLDPETGRFELTILTDDFLGIGKESDTKGTAPIQWLAYFLSGDFDDSLYWVNEDNFKIFTGESPGNLGRFGAGHLWTITDPETKKRLNSKLKAAGKSYTIESLKHPQSGKPGRNWFEGVINETDLVNLVQTPALQSAQQRVFTGSR